MYRCMKILIPVTDSQSNIIGHMEYAARKLWNVANYHLRNWQALGLPRMPSMYEQKSAMKTNMWFKSLPSQTAQEVIRDLHEGWKSYFALKKSGGIENPKPPKFKSENRSITYMENGLQHKSDTVRFTISKNMKQYMADKYDVHEQYLYLRNSMFARLRNIKTIQLELKGKNFVEAIVVYDVEDISFKPDNGHYLSIDLGVKNLMTCYDSCGQGFIIGGGRYIHTVRYFEKEIAKYRAVNAKNQLALGVKYPKDSKRICRLYQKKQNSIRDYLHKASAYIAKYCERSNISCVVVGDITGIRNGNNHGKRGNQAFHALPYRRLTEMLRYKLADRGIRLITQEESYTSQCSPFVSICKENAEPQNRIKRGLYLVNQCCYNADMVGARNILRKAVPDTDFPIAGLSDPIHVIV